MTNQPKPCVLVTRAKHQAQAFIEGCEALGFTTVHLPCIEIEPLNAPLTLANINQADLALFTSVNAVEQANRLLPFPWPVTATGIGDATTKRLAELGQQNIQPPATPNSSEGFIASLPARDIKRLALIKGTGGRELIQQKCTSLTIQCDSYDVYQRQLPKYKAGFATELLEGKTPTVICTTSNEVLENLNKLIPSQLESKIKALPLVVNSERAIELAKSLGFTSIFVADPPGDLGHLTKLEELHQS